MFLEGASLHGPVFINAGLDHIILSNKDKVFTSLFWKELFQLQGTILRMSSLYRPEMEGQTKVTNRSLETHLRCFTSETPKSWVQWLPWAELSYNTAYHSSLKTNPFNMVYGGVPPHILPYGSVLSPLASVDKALQERDRTLQRIKQQLSKAQAVMKEKAYKHR